MEALLPLVLLVLLAMVVGMPVLMILTYFRARRVRELAGRIERLEATVARLAAATEPPSRIEETRAAPAPAPPVAAHEPPAAEPVVAPPSQVGPPTSWGPAAGEAPRGDGGFQWEAFIGQRALGWMAAIVLLFAAAFFIRYAFENNWIGPIGRISMGVAAGSALLVGGRIAQSRGWRGYAQILSGAGVSLFYLSTYSAFGFYRLLPSESGGIYLLLLVVGAALLALAYDAPALALMSIIGGLLTPLLMRSVHDPYVSYFLYLALLHLGAAVMVSRRRWPAVGLVALVGVQALFWLWYSGHYHPEKFWAALAFQAAVFLTVLATHATAQLWRGRRLGWEDLVRLVANAALAFLAFYVLLRPEYRPWLGTLAVGMAVIYAALAHGALSMARRGMAFDTRLTLAALAVASAFVALAIPLEAKAQWVALGWAVQAAALVWFGYRVQAPALRAIGLAPAVLAAVRLLFWDTPRHVAFATPIWPIVNSYALPALALCAVWLIALAAIRPYAKRVGEGERILLGVGLVTGLALLGLVLSADWLGFCRGQEYYRGADREFWRWTAQTGLSVVWALYATALLIVGFASRGAVIRWTALALYAATIVKLFLFDLSGLEELYRILSFFALALFLGFAAWVYQRMRHLFEAKGQGREVRS